jgi:uncharacterized protein (TIGR02145 family)
MSSAELIMAGWRGLSGQVGGKLKSTLLADLPSAWNVPNVGATNSSGFSALPAGLRTSSGLFTLVGQYGHWWSSTSNSTSDAWRRAISNNNETINRQALQKNSGFSVRCVKD